MGFTARLLDSVSEHVLAVEPGARPRLGVAVLTCMDPRVDPLAALGLRREDAHVLRNAGGMVTPDVLESLGVSQRILGTREIVVLHHTRCAGLDARGSGRGAEASLREAVRRIIAARQLPHRDAIRGVLLDTPTGRVREVAGPVRSRDVHSHGVHLHDVRSHDVHPRHVHSHHAHAHAGSQHRASGDHHCAWCHRPFAPTGRPRWRPPPRYCGDLCRLAARRAHAQHR